LPYNTNLAAEFWVLSALYRFGVEAQLTLGNKKSVDILIRYDPKTIYTIDVKGLAGPYDWPADNIKILDNPNHFFVLLSFESKISDLLVSPWVWIVPSHEIKPFIKSYKTRIVVSRALVKKNGNKFKNAWSYFYHLRDSESLTV
jgi:hypothetical protein